MARDPQHSECLARSAWPWWDSSCTRRRDGRERLEFLSGADGAGTRCRDREPLARRANSLGEALAGDPAPSRADIQVTRQLRESAKVIGIDLIDHIVVGHKQHDPRGIGYYSFNEAGLI